MVKNHDITKNNDLKKHKLIDVDFAQDEAPSDIKRKLVDFIDVKRKLEDDIDKDI